MAGAGGQGAGGSEGRWRRRSGPPSGEGRSSQQSPHFVKRPWKGRGLASPPAGGPPEHWADAEPALGKWTTDRLKYQT